VLIDWDKLAYPYLDPETSVLDAVLQRAKSDGVDLVMVAGEVIHEGGRFTRVDRAAALKELQESLRHSLADDENELRQLSKALLPHVRRFYAGYFHPEAHLPTAAQARGFDLSAKHCTLSGHRLRLRSYRSFRAVPRRGLRWSFTGLNFAAPVVVKATLSSSSGPVTAG
jgi:hypothetical protein